MSQVCSKNLLEANGNWKGDNASIVAARARIARRMPLAGVTCVDCDNPAYDRHHIDDNPWNNERDNIAVLCRRCHMIWDGRLDAFISRGKYG